MLPVSVLQPFAFVPITEYNPDVFTEMKVPVSPVDQTKVSAPLVLSPTEPPSQNSVGPSGKIVTTGGLFTSIEIEEDVSKHPNWLFPITKKVPLL